MYEYFFNEYESSTNNGKDEDGLPDVYCVIQVWSQRQITIQ